MQKQAATTTALRRISSCKKNIRHHYPHILRQLSLSLLKLQDYESSTAINMEAGKVHTKSDATGRFCSSKFLKNQKRPVLLPSASSRFDMFRTMVKKPFENIKFIITISVGMMLGFFMGVFLPRLPSTATSSTPVVLDEYVIIRENITTVTKDNCRNLSDGIRPMRDTSKIWEPLNPRGAESLPRGIVVSESDLFPRRLWGLPKEDLPIKPKYLVAFTVGIDQKNNIDRAVKKFSDNFTILLFHYDGRTTEWDDLEWSKRAIHISARKQTKWWYAKRFLHPDIVAPYDYIFIWDEDLGVDHFDAEEYIKLVREHGLEISQPGLEPTRSMPWQMTKRRLDTSIHKETQEKKGWCPDPHLPPCAAFVEIMAPVFSRDAWRCVWHMIQNDLVHGWGLDFALQKCVEPAHEKIGVVDAQWIVHQTVPSLGNQGEEDNGMAPWKGVKLRCRREWSMFQSRMANAEKAYRASLEPQSATSL